MDKRIRKLNVFISYSHKNMKYKEKLLTSLEALKQSYNIETWHDGMIDAGGNIDENVKKAMIKSHIILLLVTDDFLASYYCINIELINAIEREKQGKCIVIPVMFQEAILSESLSFFKHNRVPRDGKPIATGFKNQNQGCTRAVQMIATMIDNNFPNCKKSLTASKVSCGVNIKAQKVSVNTRSKAQGEEVKKTKVQLPIHIGLYRNGKLSKIEVTQNMIDLIPKYHSSINSFIAIMEQSLLDAKKRYSQLYKNYKGNVPEYEKLQQLRLYLMDICAYTKTYITENVGIKVHFRVSKENSYLGFIASTDADNATDLSANWAIKMTPIPMYQGLIYHSSKINAALIKSLNSKLNYKGKNDDIWKDYITFTFPKFHSGRTPLISYCISIHKDYYKTKRDMLKILAYLNLGEVIEKCILDYCDICKGIDKTYNLENIINVL